MGVKKNVVRSGNGRDIPKKHDEVAMEYTGKQCGTQLGNHSMSHKLLGWLYSDAASDKKGHR